ncbi:MAG TPA: hypothetical protein VD996_05820 [Chitinophagaceae bacterium]|nr:hypothetical protein [Chitinophagaceae bacterium]
MATSLATGQQVRRSNVPETPLEPLNDEFSDNASLQGWQKLHTIENFPDKIRHFSVSEGTMKLQPFASGWYGDYQAPFLFKTVSGDFDVRARIKVSGRQDSLPQSEWSLAGLMVRQAKQTTSAEWQPNQENWLFFTTGIAEPKGTPVFEVKTTNNSISNLKLRPAKAGWVELRIVRVQASFILMYRYTSQEPWTIIERFYRPLLPYQLQVGINAYSGWNEVPNDIRKDPAIFNKTLLKDPTADIWVEADYIRFSRPVLNMEGLRALRNPNFNAPYYTPANLLTDYSVSNETVLSILGN